MKTFDELVEGIKELKEKGFIKTHRTGDTGIGKALEDLLGVDENNFPGPDGQDTELKSARKNSSSMLTLFTKSPLPIGVNSKLRLEYGYPDEKFSDKPVLRTTINSLDFNTVKGKKGFMLVSKNDRIEIALPRKPQQFPEMQNPFWPKEEFEKSIKKKYKKSLLYVKADSKGTGLNEKFHYNEAYLLEGFDFKTFSKNIQKGILKVDIRLGLYNDGRFHDHGTGIRINPSLLDLIFSKRKRVV